MSTKLEFLIIDPQFDFCDPSGSLYVPGADKDIERLAKVISRMKDDIDDIHVTLDSHHLIDVGHPIFWLDANGKHPGVFTIITSADLKSGKYRTTNSSWMSRETMRKANKDRDGVIEYCEKLEANGRYPLCIWPPHCLISTLGATVMPELGKSLMEWENQFNMVEFVTKGSNYMTEHYSAVQADVPDPEDPTTQLNKKFIDTLQEAETIVISGQALSHCVANTIRDIANNFGDKEYIKKFVLLEDTCSNVPGFEHFGVDFVKEMTGRGMRICKSTDFCI